LLYIKKIKEKEKEPGLVVYVCNPSTWELRKEELEPGLHK
jgi:hypothetical protein